MSAYSCLMKCLFFSFLCVFSPAPVSSFSSCPIALAFEMILREPKAIHFWWREASGGNSNNNKQPTKITSSSRTFSSFSHWERKAEWCRQCSRTVLAYFSSIGPVAGVKSSDHIGRRVQDRAGVSSEADVVWKRGATSFVDVDFDSSLFIKKDSCSCLCGPRHSPPAPLLLQDD